MRDTVGEVRMNSLVTFFDELLYMGMPGFAEQVELFYVNSLRTQDVVWKTNRERRTLGMNGERKLGKSVLAVRLDQDDD